jgi:hypothetical protein
MKFKAKFPMFVAACNLLFLSLPALARPANSPQDQASPQTQSVQKDEKHKVQSGPGKEVGKGGEDIGKGAGKGAGSLGKGTAGAAGNLVTLPLAMPPPISAKAPQVPARTSESAPAKARPRSAKAALRVSGN